ncbi:MAG TPA: NAD-dependent epimerase/dehydratase family protein [Chitinophagaceae bacterium]|nr:NAD-dependent epimerase/dehydratase family protein [Bacteroidota bacterium]MCB9074621.1 NAD-dependent epimerase/dehydratase family protein [Chitinophagales bacterium]HNL82502.1 NAD-dependent epimerase/dehydratase family protein [Chitinophagaceae bacterium]HNM67785.1 NAD-dependent epimerase/dehydratase family protein [Chitinophagales bacterium]
MVKILITGGAGFIPSSLADKLLQDENNYVVLVDNLLTGNTANIPKHKNCKFIKCDANNYAELSAIMTAHGFDYVFHYAAVVGVQRTLQNPVMVLDDIKGIENILSLSKNTGVKRIFYSSSSEVYGEPVTLPQNEYTTPLNSRLPYAVVKNIGEAYCRSYHQEFGLDYTIFRFFNTYGPKQSQDFVMSKFLNAALNNKDITVYGDGLQTRTFCYIDDNLDACLTTFNNDAYKNDVYNIGNDDIITIKQLAETIIELTNSKSKIIHLPPLKEGDMTKRQPDISKMKELLNRDLLPYRDGIKKVINAWKI